MPPFGEHRRGALDCLCFWPGLHTRQVCVICFGWPHLEHWHGTLDNPQIPGQTHHYYTVRVIVVKYEENMVSNCFRDAGPGWIPHLDSQQLSMM